MPACATGSTTRIRATPESKASGSSYGGGSSSTQTTTKSSASSGGGYGGGYGSTTKSSTGGGGATVSGSGSVTLVDNAFQPSTISGKAGSTVKLALKNTGQAEHTFTIDSQHVNTTLTPGKTAAVSVKIPASGSVQFYCQYHKALGMTGTLKAS